MTSHPSSTLLQESVSTDAPRSTQASPSRLVTRVVAQPQPPVAWQPAPQPVYVAARPAGIGIAGVALALVVLLVGLVALGAGYLVTRESSPSDAEASIVSSVAVRNGFDAGRARGLQAGRADAVELSSTTAALRAADARQQAWNAAYRRGERAGRSSYRPRSYGGYRGRGFSGYRYSSGYGQVASALGQAQNIANLTGAPVDVEVY